MKLIRSLFLTGFCIGLIGCAANPESIAPAYVSYVTYQSWTCRQLAEEQSRLIAALSSASDAQRTARANDTMGVILLGLPVSSLSGSNQASNVARLKGELDAVQKAMTVKGCSAKIIPASEAVQKKR